MKIYQVNSTARYSTGTLARAIHTALLHEGHEARFAYGNGGEHTEGLYQIGSTLIQRIDAKFEQLTGMEGVFTKRQTKRLIRDIEQFNPDVIHLHNVHGNYLHQKTFFQYLADKEMPVIVTLHDCWLMTGGCTHFTRNACNGWKATCSNCKYEPHFLLKKVYSLSEKKLRHKKMWFQNIKNLTVVTVSQWLKDIAQDSHFRDREVVAIYNGINTEDFKPMDVAEQREALGLTDVTVILGVASTWNEGKGLREWIQLADALGDSYKIMLVGLNESQQTENMPQNIIPIGKTESSKQLAEYYNLADVFINMSYEETFGLTTAEAMSCGTPAIVINSTANPELVTEETGIIIDKRTLDALKDAVQFIQKKGVDTYKEACVKHAQRYFAVEGMTQKYIALYLNSQR